MFKTILNTFKLRYYCWIVNNLQNDLFELETVKKSNNFTFRDKYDLTLEIMDTQKELIKMKKKVKELEERL